MNSVEEKPNNGGFTDENSDESSLNLSKLIRRGDSLSEIFFALTRHLHETFEINKGVLILRQEQPKKLAAVSTWKNGLGRDGLALSLPNDSSLFEQVAEQGEVYTEHFCGAFSGNFFERKLLLDDDSRSFVLQPLKSDGQVVGLLGYSSQSATAFAMFEEGAMDNIAEELGSVIEAGKYSL
jgi:transcriptional regulator with GAF, ATPase, and Fis domain